MTQDKGKARRDDFVNRREMLVKLGRYSIVAAGALAIPKSVMRPKSTAQSVGAVTSAPVQFGQGWSFWWTAPSSDKFVFTLDVRALNCVNAYIDITSFRADYSNAVVCKVTNSMLVDFVPPKAISFAQKINLDNLPGDLYYITFECRSGTAEVTFYAQDSGTPCWSNAYSDYSDWSDAYSDWSDAYSDWSDSYSDYSDWYDYFDWSNYSDSYYVWGNWMQSW